MTIWYDRQLNVDGPTQIEAFGKTYSVDRYFESIGQAFDAFFKVEDRLFVVTMATRGEKHSSIVRYASFSPTTLETPEGDTWMMLAESDEKGVATGQRNVVELTRIYGIGVFGERLPLALQPLNLDDHLGECVIMEFRPSVPNLAAVPVHGTLERVKDEIAYKLGTPDHDYNKTARSSGQMIIPYIGIARVTRCPAMVTT